MPDSCGAHATCANAVRLYLENVVGHLPGQDASLCWMNTSDGVPVRTTSNSRGDNLAITIAQRERT